MTAVIRVETTETVVVDGDQVTVVSVGTQGPAGTGGGGGGSAVDVEESDVVVVSAAASIDFLGTDFDVAAAGTEANVSIATSHTGSSHASISSTAAANLAAHEADTTAIHGITDTSLLVTLAGSQTLTNKTLTSPVITSPTLTVLDTGFTVQDNLDATKQAVFQASGITTGTTRTYTFPDANTTLVGTDATQTLTNKSIAVSQLTGTLAVANGGTGVTTSTGTGSVVLNSSPTLTTPTIGSFTNATHDHSNAAGGGQITLTTGVTGTLPVANGGTGQTTATAAFNALDPLTTKGDLIVHDGTNSVRQAVGADGLFLKADSTQTNGVIWATASGGGSTIVVQEGDVTVDGSVTTIDFAAADFDVTSSPAGEANVSLATTITGHGLTVADNVLTVQDNLDATKQAQFQLSGITTGTTRTYTLPDRSDTLVDLGSAQTLTSKTLTTPTIGDFTNSAHNHANAAGGGQISLTAAVTGTLPVANGGTGVTSSTGTGSVVLSSSPTLVTPTLGVASATSLTLTTDLAVADGGTGASTHTANAVLLGNGTAAITAVSGLGNSGQVLTSQGAGSPPSWQNAGTGFQPLDQDLTDIAGLTRTRGDIIVGSATQWTDLAIGAANRVLRSDGTDPSWAQVALTTDVTGTLPVANGGTGVTTSTGSGANVLGTSPTITTPVLTVNDNDLSIRDNVDTTKIAQFQVSGLSTATTRTFTFPDANTTLVGTDTTQTLTNKTINVSQLTGTLPVANGGTGVTSSTGSGSVVLNTSPTLTTPVINVNDNDLSIRDNVDTTKIAQFQVSGITTGTTRTFTFPDATTTLVGTDTTQTLTNKTINVSQLTGTLGVANGGTGVTSSTGTGSVVLNTSPTLVTPTLGAASATSLTLTTDLAVADGGTGASTHTANAVLLGNGTSAITAVSGLGTSGQLLTSQGPGTPPIWQTFVGGSGNVATDVIWDAAGDLAIGTGADTAVRLAIGGPNTVLTSNGTTATWAVPGAASTNIDVQRNDTSIGTTFNTLDFDTSYVLTVDSATEVRIGLPYGQIFAVAANMAMA